jgi:hypothetical protein
MSSNRKPKPPDEPRRDEEARATAARRNEAHECPRRPTPIKRTDWPGEGVVGDHHTD